MMSYNAQYGNSGVPCNRIVFGTEGPALHALPVG